MKKTFFKSTLNTQGILHICRPVARLGWQGRLTWVVVIEHDGSRSDIQIATLANKLGGIAEAVNRGHWTFEIIEIDGKAQILPKKPGPSSADEKDAKLHLRLSMAKKAEYVRRAQNMGMTLTEWCLAALDRGYIADEDRDAVKAIK